MLKDAKTALAIVTTARTLCRSCDKCKTMMGIKVPNIDDDSCVACIRAAENKGKQDGDNG